MVKSCDCGGINFDEYEPEEDRFSYMCVSCGKIPEPDSPLAMALLKQSAMERGRTFSKNPETEILIAQP